MSGDDNQEELRDPVCGRPVDPLRARAVGIFGGVTHYFCSPECKAKYTDPRSSDQGPPGEGERRLAGASSGEWFAAGRAPAPATTVDRFADLETGAVPVKAQPPSASLLVEVAAARRRRPWGLVAVSAAVVLGLGWLLLAR